MRPEKKAKESVRIKSPNQMLTEDSNAMKSITQNKRYLPHEMSTKINSVKLYRQTGDIGFVVRRYHISKASLMRWNRQYDGTRESLQSHLILVVSWKTIFTDFDFLHCSSQLCEKAQLSLFFDSLTLRACTRRVLYKQNAFILAFWHLPGQSGIGFFDCQGRR